MEKKTESNKIKLTQKEQAKKEALDQIYYISKYNIIAFAGVLILVSSLLFSKASSYIIITGLFLHASNLFHRFQLRRQYFEIDKKNFTPEILRFWTLAYIKSTFISGFLWGITLFVLGDIEIHEYYILFGINIGFTSAAALSLGIVPSIFLSFSTPILGLSILWLLLQGGQANIIIALVTSVGFVYYFLSTLRYARVFKQMILDKHSIKTHLKELETIQKKSEILRQRTELALNGSDTSVLDWNFSDKTFYISPSWKEMLGYQDSELPSLYSTWKDRIHKDDLRNVITSLKISRELQEPNYQTQHRLKHKDGHYIWVLGKSQQIYSSNGKLIRMIGTYINITKEKNIQESLLLEKEKFNYQAHHDALTGLANRVLFMDRLKKSLTQAKRHSTIMALLFIDLDHFKAINDSLGHDIGDKVLQQVTLTLQKTVREEDSIARLGGDEFTIVLEDLHKIQDISQLAQKIVKILAKPMYIDGHELYISSSIGISLYPNDGDNCTDLLKFADSAMYKAKAEGRNTFQFYSWEMTEKALERVTMEAQLRDAIKNKEFVVYYQVQVNASSDKIVGMEALVRWIHPSYGLISPAKFIPIAEATGLIIEIDRFVMKTAMSQVSKWHHQGLKPGKLAMNLAMKQLQDKSFIPYFQNLIEETNCHANHLELEVTEGQIMKNPEEAIKVLSQLSDLGIKLAVDDFGTGYSSLSYLKKLPINKLKIDQSFVQGLPDDKEDAAIAKAVIALAQSLNLTIIAEGVETQAQKDFMLRNACENIQGYFYSKPLPATEFEVLLTKGFV